MVGSVSFLKLGRILSICLWVLLRKQRIGSWITRIVDWSKEWTWASLLNLGSRVRIRLFHILHFVSDLLFSLLKISKSEVGDRGHPLRITHTRTPLTNYPHDYPSDTDFEPEFTEEILREMNADKVLFTSATKKYSLKDIINVERLSTYRKLLRTTAADVQC